MMCRSSDSVVRMGPTGNVTLHINRMLYGGGASSGYASSSMASETYKEARVLAIFAAAHCIDSTQAISRSHIVLLL